MSLTNHLLPICNMIIYATMAASIVLGVDQGVKNSPENEVRTKCLHGTRP
jgi:hypothetical protein